MDRSVFLTGTLHQLNPILLDWDPHGQQIKKADDRHWTIPLTGPENAEIAYKYVLGNSPRIFTDETDLHDFKN